MARSSLGWWPPAVAMLMAGLAAGWPGRGLAQVVPQIGQPGGGQIGGAPAQPDDEAAAPAPKLRPKGAKDYVPPATPLTQGGEAQSVIAAVVNGDVISDADIEARAKLFALSTGLPLSPDVIGRLKAQVLRALIDEKLRLQEIERRKVVVLDDEIADAIKGIEGRNRMAPGTLVAKLAAAGVPMRSLIDELRVQIGWTRVLRDALGSRARVTKIDIEQQHAIAKAEQGKPEYDIAEIFIPYNNPAHAEQARNFANTVITQLRAGAPFSVVATQFSQSQSALEGGEVGWRQVNDMEPSVASVVTQMPQGAISNPIEVPGGYMVVSLHGKRTVGTDLQTVLSLREAFLPFSTPLNPQAPTDQQKETLQKARELSARAKSCDDIESANKDAGDARPSDPGEVRLANVSPPAFQQLLAAIPLQKPSQPLVSPDGIVVLAVCSRAEKNVATETDEQIAERLVNERADLVSRQLERDLHRRGVIDIRQPGIGQS